MDLKNQIYRYLDGELTPGEMLQLRRTLSASPEARELFEELQAVSRAARQIPSRHIPPAEVENTLFHRLRGEGLYARSEKPAPTAAKAPLPGKLHTSRFTRRAGVPALLLLLTAIAAGAYWLTEGGDRQSIPVLAGTSVWGSERVQADRGVHINVPEPVIQPTAPKPNSITARVGKQPSAVEPTKVVAVPTGNVASVTPAKNSDAAERIAANHSDREYEVRRPAILPPARMVADTQRTDIRQIAALPVMPEGIPTAPQPGTISSGRQDHSLLAASVRYGHSTIDGISTGGGEEVQVQLDVQLGKGHRLSLVGGRSPIANHLSTFAILSASPGMTATSTTTTTVEQQNETWGGVGYTYSLPLSSDIAVGLGGNVGVGSESWRSSLEMPIELKVTDRLTLECVPSISQINPIDRNEESVYIFSRVDNKEETRRPFAYTAYSIELGLRVELW